MYKLGLFKFKLNMVHIERKKKEDLRTVLSVQLSFTPSDVLS